MRGYITAAVMGSCLLLTHSAQAQVSARADTAVTPQSVSQGLRLQPGDIIRLRIWREPDLSGDFPIDEAGRVNLPLVGSYVVTNETRETLKDKLSAAYRQSIENLSMDVIFIRRVAVVGAVRTPGLYLIEPTMTVGDAIAMAGGSTIEAKRTKIILMRSGQALMADVDAALLVNDLPLRRGDQLYIPAQDSFLSRNTWVIGTAIQALLTLVTLVRR